MNDHIDPIIRKQLELEIDVMNEVVELMERHELFAEYDLTDHLDVLLTDGWTISITVEAVHP